MSDKERIFIFICVSQSTWFISRLSCSLISLLFLRLTFINAIQFINDKLFKWVLNDIEGLRINLMHQLITKKRKRYLYLLINLFQTNDELTGTCRQESTLNSYWSFSYTPIRWVQKVISLSAVWIMYFNHTQFICKQIRPHHAMK